MHHCRKSARTRKARNCARKGQCGTGSRRGGNPRSGGRASQRARLCRSEPRSRARTGDRSARGNSGREGTRSKKRLRLPPREEPLEKDEYERGRHEPMPVRHQSHKPKRVFKPRSSTRCGRRSQPGRAHLQPPGAECGHGTAGGRSKTAGNSRSCTATARTRALTLVQSPSSVPRNARSRGPRRDALPPDAGGRDRSRRRPDRRAGTSRKRRACPPRPGGPNAGPYHVWRKSSRCWTSRSRSPRRATLHGLLAPGSTSSPERRRDRPTRNPTSC